MSSEENAAPPVDPVAGTETDTDRSEIPTGSPVGPPTTPSSPPSTALDVELGAAVDDGPAPGDDLDTSGEHTSAFTLDRSSDSVWHDVADQHGRDQPEPDPPDDFRSGVRSTAQTSPAAMSPPPTTRHPTILHTIPHTALSSEVRTGSLPPIVPVVHRAHREQRPSSPPDTPTGGESGAVGASPFDSHASTETSIAPSMPYTTVARRFERAPADAVDRAVVDTSPSARRTTMLPPIRTQPDHRPRGADSPTSAPTSTTPDRGGLAALEELLVARTGTTVTRAAPERDGGAATGPTPPMPDRSAADRGEAATVDRAEAAGAELAVAGGAPSASVDELTDRVYRQVRRRLRVDLHRERERRGGPLHGL